MTYGLDLFSDAPPASMPTTATITTTANVLLGLCLSQWERCGHALRIGLFVLITGFFATSVSAQTVGDFRAWVPWGSYYVYGSSAAAACDAMTEIARPMYAPTAISGAVVGTYKLAAGGLGWRDIGQKCRGTNLSNGTTLWDFSMARYGDGCPAGTEIDPVTGACRPPPCQEGVSATLNLGVGYAKTTRNVDDWINPQFYTTSCNAGCQVTVGAIVAGSCGVGGLVGPPYPGYCEFETTTTGNECTAGDEATTEPLPPIPCPTGMQPGTVNGAAGCYAVSTATKETTVTDNGDGTTTTTETVTGPTGTTTTTTTCNGDGACSSTTTHVGGGGSTGAPGELGQDYDGKPDGGEQGEDEGEGACGKEGLPDCKVKVNEDGTPEEVEGMQAALDGVLQGVQEQFDYLGGMGWVREELPFVWNPSFPSGSCAAVEIHGYQIDICEPLGKARMVWAFVLAFMAGLYIWRQSTEVMKGA